MAGVSARRRSRLRDPAVPPLQARQHPGEHVVPADEMVVEGLLVNGMARKIGPFSIDATAPMRSFASVHQLLPTYPCVEVDGAMLRVAEADLAGVEPTLARDAARFHDEIASAQVANCKLEGYDPGAVATVVSTRQPTFQSASIVDGKLVLARSHLGNFGG